jgi:hypothetical protein
MNANKNNPYSDKDGKPKTGFMHQFFAFEKEKESKRREGLSADERKSLDKADENLSSKMNS